MQTLLEKKKPLDAYHASIQFIPFGDSILRSMTERVSACDHLSRAMEGIPLHIAKANQTWSAKERVTYLGHANGSVLECAACLDVLQVKGLLTKRQIKPGKESLHLICNMLVAMQKTASNRIRETSPQPYRPNPNIYFSHERLDVYKVSLIFVEWTETLNWTSTCGGEMKNRLDKSSTSIALNIAEGNGRFTKTDHAHFLSLAQSSVARSMAGLDIATARDLCDELEHEHGKLLLARISSMLTAMRKRLKTPSSPNLSTKSID